MTTLRNRIAVRLAAAALLAATSLTAMAAPSAAPDSAGAARRDEARALDVSQAAIGRSVGDYAFVDSRNRRVSLAAYRGKPLVVSLVYTGCTDVCPVISERLAEALGVARDALGDDSFRVVTIGFDTGADTPQRMAAFARSHGLAAANWDFLSGSADSVDRLANDLGFLFAAAPQGFDHMAQTTVIDADGVVYRQVYGAAFDLPLLVEPLKELVFGRRSDLTSVAGLINRVRLFCTVYDPASGRYRFDYSLFAAIAGGGLSLASIATWLVINWRRSRRAAGSAAASAKATAPLSGAREKHT